MVWSCPCEGLWLWKRKEEQAPSVMPRATPASLPGPSSPSLPSLPSSPPSHLSPRSPACSPPVWAGSLHGPFYTCPGRRVTNPTRNGHHQRSGYHVTRADVKPSPRLPGEKGLSLFSLVKCSGMDKPHNAGPWGKWPTRRACCHPCLWGQPLDLGLWSPHSPSPTCPTPPPLGLLLAVRAGTGAGGAQHEGADQQMWCLNTGEQFR